MHVSLFIRNIVDEQLDFPVLYASAKEGWASKEFTKGGTVEENKMGMGPLLDAIVEHVQPPSGDLKAPFQMLVRLLLEDSCFAILVTCCACMCIAGF